MMQRIGMAIGAGLAAALLFAVIVKGTLLSVALSFLAPLPIVIVTLGWGLDMGALAVIVAGGVGAGLVEPLSGARFGVLIAFPAWALGALFLLRRDWLFARGAGPAERPWFPVGGIAAAAALFGALLGVEELAALIISNGGYEQGVAAFADQLVPRLTEFMKEDAPLPGGLSTRDLAELFVRLTPPVLATGTTLMFCVNLYAGARAVQLSQRLKRPWPDLPESLILPPPHGTVAHVSWMFLGPLCCVYVLQGLAVVHALSRRLQARLPLLIIFYLVSWMASPLAAPMLVLLGLAESLFSLRGRRAAAANAKP
jgi:hypothetical protein